MATLFAASESSVMVDGEAIDGVRAIEYRFQQQRSNVYALGSTERVGMVSGGQTVEGRLRVASTMPSSTASSARSRWSPHCVIRVPITKPRR